MASRIVEIKRISLTRQDRIYTDSKKSIGSVMTKTGETAHGLTHDEIKKLMPNIVNVDSTEFNFRQKVDEYFKALTLRPDKVSGLRLEIGLDENDDPINSLEYVHYKFALQSPRVARNGDDIKHGVSMFLVTDKEKELVETHDLLEKRRKAYKEYIKLLDDSKKFKVVAMLLSSDLGYGIMEIKNVDEREVKIKLEKFVQDYPEKFYDLISDKHLSVRAFIEECISAGALNRVGKAILNGDQKIGSSIEEAIMFLTDKANSEIYVTLKARVSEYKKIN